MFQVLRSLEGCACSNLLTAYTNAYTNTRHADNSPARQEMSAYRLDGTLCCDIVKPLYLSCSKTARSYMSVHYTAPMMPGFVPSRLYKVMCMHIQLLRTF